MLVDRVAEADVLKRLLASVREGLSGVLVLRGQAGIGKTALLDWAAGQAEDMQVARVAGVESEMDLGFAGLHQLLVPFLDRLEWLPKPQRDALGAAFGMAAGPAPDRFLVGLGALTLITQSAVRRPVLCVVDDAQWLDRVSVEVLGFVARRLFADRVGMLFAVRAGEQRTVALEGLPELTVGALPEEAAVELLAASAGRAVDLGVGARIVAETAGNPLALMEFGGELTAAEASGAVPLAEPLRFGGHLEELYRPGCGRRRTEDRNGPVFHAEDDGTHRAEERATDQWGQPQGPVQRCVDGGLGHRHILCLAGTTAPGIAVAGQKAVAIALLASGVGRRHEPRAALVP